MKAFKIGLLLLVICLGVLIWNYPANALNGTVQKLSQGRLQILNSSGSIWVGQAQLGVSDGTRVLALPGLLSWHVVTGKADMGIGLGLAIQLNHVNLIEPVYAGITYKGVQWTAGEMQLPANWLAALGAPFNTIRPEGLLQLSWDVYGPEKPLKLVVKWLDAQSALASVRPLGEYVIRITGNPDVQLDTTLTTNRGPLFLEGQGMWKKGQPFVFNGHAHADERNKVALRGLLSQMGKQQGEHYLLGVF